jgi:predicted CXXCH cytochrome family protein
VARIACVFAVAAMAPVAIVMAVPRGRERLAFAASEPASTAPARATDVGAAACRPCHTAAHRAWSAGRHGRMIQPASAASVLGDFGRGKVTLRGLPYGLRRDGEAFYVTERYLDVEPRERRVDYTLGSRRVQHYLARLEDGRIVVLPPSWDVQRGEWFHNLDIVDPEETAERRVQVWNASCVGCHVSREEKNYDPRGRRYDTRWMDFGTSCERCHGPGSLHVERRRAEEEDSAAEIVRPSTLGPMRESMICAQCHSLRDVVSPDYVAGGDYYDAFMPILEYAQKVDRDPAWWADGRPRRFSNDALGFWQSACFLRGGASCTTCHTSVHSPEVDRAPALRSNALCLQCHEPIGRALAAHTRHRADGPGSSCVECHMPKAVVSLRRSTMRDHTIGLPAPENTRRFGIPNACTGCHEDRSPAWAEAALRRWFGPGRRPRMVARAEAFAGAREAKTEALDRLLAIAGDAREPFLVRANAVGHLRRYADTRATEGAVRALGADHPLIRAVAAMTLAERSSGGTAGRPALVRALADPARTVRVAAGFALVSAGTTTLPGADGERLEAAKRDYVARAALLEDDLATQMNLGKFHLLDRQAARAAAAFENVRALKQDQPGLSYFLGFARVLQGRAAEGRQLLESIPAGDPYRPHALEILRRLDSPP